jgi:hypothetical protein
MKLYYFKFSQTILNETTITLILFRISILMVKKLLKVRIFIRFDLNWLRCGRTCD